MQRSGASLSLSRIEGRSLELRTGRKDFYSLDSISIYLNLVQLLVLRKISQDAQGIHVKESMTTKYPSEGELSGTVDCKRLFLASSPKYNGEDRCAWDTWCLQIGKRVISIVN